MFFICWVDIMEYVVLKKVGLNVEILTKLCSNHASFGG